MLISDYGKARATDWLTNKTPCRWSIVILLRYPSTRRTAWFQVVEHTRESPELSATKEQVLEKLPSRNWAAFSTR